jgi:glycosyltransferase involved in cell wall biosynthesis
MVSIIICTRNRARALAQTLDALQQIAVPEEWTAELVVVDNGSTDGTGELLRAFRWAHGRVVAVDEPRPGKGHAYNRGLAAAAGDVLLLTDDDVRPPRDWLQTVCAPIAAGRAEMVAGGVRLAAHLERAWMTPALRSLLSSTELLDAREPAWVVAANLAFSREVLSRVPAFDTELGPGALGFEEEVLFSWQAREAGYRVTTALEPPVEHWFDADRLAHGALARYMRAHGRSKAFVEYHWLHRELPAAQRAWWRARLRLLWQRLRHVTDWRRTEGIAEWEADALRLAGYLEQYLIERQRPRQYARRGLVKLPTA